MCRVFFFFFFFFFFLLLMALPCVCRRAHACTQLMRRGVEWSTDEALWRLRALESGVWVGSLLSSH